MLEFWDRLPSDATNTTETVQKMRWPGIDRPGETAD
jgi:hypothetical protein